MTNQSTYQRTIWVKPNDPTIIQAIDQRALPHELMIEDISSVNQMAIAIKDMHLRGAGLIGAAAGYGMYLAALEATDSDDFEQHLNTSADLLTSTRPTAVNLTWAIQRQLKAMDSVDDAESKVQMALTTANNIADEDAGACKQIGRHGLDLIKMISDQKHGQTVNILTHCNAGWLAFVEYGTATAPIYAAYDAGIKVHVWIDETRPRNQGARLTAWELQQRRVPHTIIADNVGGHLMQKGMVDLVITGTDRTTRTGDVANKIGTYLKALAAQDNDVPFYVALPSSTFDWDTTDGSKIPIESRSGDEVKYISGLQDGEVRKVLLTPVDSPAANYAFDVTPSRLVTGLITERGICKAYEESILELFPEQKKLKRLLKKVKTNEK